MIAYLPLPGGHIKLAERFVNPALSFAMVSRLVHTMSPSLKISTTGMELLYVATSLMRWHDQFGSPYLSIKGTTGQSFYLRNSALRPS